MHYHWNHPFIFDSSMCQVFVGTFSYTMIILVSSNWKTQLFITVYSIITIYYKQDQTNELSCYAGNRISFSSSSDIVSSNNQFATEQLINNINQLSPGTLGKDSKPLVLKFKRWCAFFDRDYLIVPNSGIMLLVLANKENIKSI